MEVQESALYLRKASVVIDVPQSIWQRNIVFKDFMVEAVELNLEQLESGVWQLRGLSSGSDEPMDFEQAYQTLSQVSQLSLRNVVINPQEFDGDIHSFGNGLATISNAEAVHYLHANITLAGSREEMALSFEVTGDSLNEMSGQLHIDLPQADYSELLSRQSFAELSVGELLGGGEVWVRFEQGEAREFFTDI
ncbi:unnamed protein product, partial [Scytosiphon promiscuus]